MEKNIEWSTVFIRIQEFCNKYSCEIKDFAINEMTLEDIFLQLYRSES